ncbi:hypothetical protein AB0G00_13175 [Nocardia salmonicida]
MSTRLIRYSHELATSVVVGTDGSETADIAPGPVPHPSVEDPR